jgi:hypothetical protein
MTLKEFLDSFTVSDDEISRAEALSRQHAKHLETAWLPLVISEMISDCKSFQATSKVMQLILTPEQLALDTDKNSELRMGMGPMMVAAMLLRKTLRECTYPLPKTYISPTAFSSFTFSKTPMTRGRKT